MSASAPAVPPGTSSSAADAVLRIDDLSVTFVRRERDLPVVNHVSFEIGAALTRNHQRKPKRPLSLRRTG